MGSSEQKIPSVVLSIDRKRQIDVFDDRTIICSTFLKVVIGSLLVRLLPTIKSEFLGALIPI
uniref:Uncharacterized protein n=1 Tax=Cucumis melo TaxID=3656 RepID=A0A9I9EEL6_CUCME